MVQPIAIMTPKGAYSVRPLNQPIYDRIAYPAAGAIRLDLFVLPIGGAKTMADTNLTKASCVGTPNLFHLDGFNFVVEQRVAAANTLTAYSDFSLITNTGAFHFGVGSNRDLFYAPLSKIPTGLRPMFTGSRTSTAITGALAASVCYGVGDSDINNYYDFTQRTARGAKRRILLMSEESLNCSLEWAALAALAAAPVNVRVSLRGTYYRGL